MEARSSGAAPKRPEVAAKARDDSLLGYFGWLLFSFDFRLDRRTYRYARMVANVGYLLALWGFNAAAVKFADNPPVVLSLSLVLLALSVAMIWSTLAMQVKRRHDRDQSWPWLFVGFVPIAGPIWVLIECCWLAGTPGYNRFDEPAKRAAATFA